METITDLLKSIESKLRNQIENNSFAFTVSWDSIYEQNKNTAYHTQNFVTPIVLNIANEIRRQVGEEAYNGMSLERNDATLKAVFKLKPQFRVDFTQPSSIRSILGFESK
jgi:hypothetical protein